MAMVFFIGHFLFLGETKEQARQSGWQSKQCQKALPNSSAFTPLLTSPFDLGAVTHPNRGRADIEKSFAYKGSKAPSPPHFSGVSA